MFNFDDGNKYGKEAFDSTLKSYSLVAKGFQELATEAQDYSKKCYEDGAAMVEKFARAKSIDKAFEIQTEYAKASYETFIARATKMSEIYTGIAKEAYKSYEQTAGKAGA